MMDANKFTPIIGLEIHVELKTKSKMFCGCVASYFGEKPNTHTCPVCLGLPGALPVPNSKAIEWCVMLGQALNCRIPLQSKFDRKNYFYPDLPKGYQISQYDQPFAVNGWLDIKSKIQSSNIKPACRQGRSNPNEQNSKRIRIRRVHMEEDTAKLVHQFGMSNVKPACRRGRCQMSNENYTLIDFNRSGVPLVEIVTEPDIHTSEEAKAFLKELYLIIRYLGISDADMEKGSMRLEPNISVLKTQSSNVKTQNLDDKSIKLPDYKVEVKNINSFNFVKKAIDYEIERQIELLQKSETPVQETRGWNEGKGITYSQRAKEEAHDYRYFPEPDIPPIVWKKDYLDEIKSKLPELPEKKRERYVSSYKIREYNADVLINSPEQADFFEKSLDIVRQLTGEKEEINPQKLVNLIINKKVDINKETPASLIKLILEKRKKPEISPDLLNQAVEKVLSQNQKAVDDYKKGKEQVLMFLVGQVMRVLKGKADATTIRKGIINQISKHG